MIGIMVKPKMQHDRVANPKLILKHIKVKTAAKIDDIEMRTNYSLCL